MNKPLLSVKNLTVDYASPGLFTSRSANAIRAVDNVSFVLEAGTTLGLVGESGSGKSSLGRALIQLTPATSGEVIFDGVSLLKLSRKEIHPFRRRIQMIFQDPYNSLNPRWTVGSIIAEPLQIHFKDMDSNDRRSRAIELLKKVGLTELQIDRYPHEFSGGQRQRIGIARALAAEPELIICDEPVSALDVSVQAHIVNLLMDLQEELNLTYLFIAHDLAVVEHVSDNVMVMQQGKIVETASAEKLYQSPQHPYTQKLLASVPELKQ